MKTNNFHKEIRTNSQGALFLLDIQDKIELQQASMSQKSCDNYYIWKKCFFALSQKPDCDTIDFGTKRLISINFGKLY